MVEGSQPSREGAARPAHSRDVFAIAGPAMLANLTTPLLGVVATAAIGRLGDATLLGGVAMASVIFDCLFWLFSASCAWARSPSPRRRWARGELHEFPPILLRGLHPRRSHRHRC